MLNPVREKLCHAIESVFSFICVFEGYIKDKKFLLLLTGLQLGNMLAKSAYPKEYNFLYYVH